MATMLAKPSIAFGLAVLLGSYAWEAGAPETAAEAWGASGAPDTVVAERISFTFGWPVGMRTRVDYRMSEITLIAGDRDSVAGRLVFDMTVAPHPAGRLIRCEYDSVFTADYLALVVPELNMSVADLLQLVTPSIVVDDYGGFVGLDDPGPSRRFRDRMAGSLIDSIPPDHPDLRSLVLSLTGERTFTAKADEFWGQLVGYWAGAELEVGRVYASEARGESPIASGGTICVANELSLTGRVPCHPGDPCCRCVRLEVLNYPDPGAMTAFMHGLARFDAPDSILASLVGTHIGVKRTVILVTDPTTLQPHDLTVTIAMTLTRDDPDSPSGSRAFAVKERRCLYSFSYGDASH